MTDKGTPDLSQATPEEDSWLELKEKLAAIEHTRWADWQKWVHDCLLSLAIPDGVLPDKRIVHYLPEEIRIRWQRQIDTPYAELSDSEKASDMEQVDRYWPLIEAAILSKLTEARIDELELLVKNHNTKSKQRITNCSVVNNLVKRRLSKLQAQLPKKED